MGTEGVISMVESEILAADNPKILFRGNSIATKALDQYMKRIGSDYLKRTLKAVIEHIFSLNESFEVDPSRIVSKNPKKTLNEEEKEKTAKQNMAGLLANAEAISYAIFKSAPQFPSYYIFNSSDLAKVFRHIRKLVTIKFPNEDVRYTAISGFLFLRFFCPAILSPKLFHLMGTHPNEQTSRCLTLLAKIVQNLANLTEFQAGGKEVHMMPVLFIANLVRYVYS